MVIYVLECLIKTLGGGEVNKYQLIIGCHGGAEGNDYTEKVVAYFTSIEKAINYFKKHNILRDYWDKKKDFDLSVKLTFPERRRGLGSLDYRIELIPELPSLLVDPQDLIINYNEKENKYSYHFKETNKC